MTIKPFKPMLASPVDFSKLRFPVFASPKLDGIRVVIKEGLVLTRSLKEVPNQFIKDALCAARYNGLDGELIVGAPNAEDVYRQTNSGVMSRTGEPDFTFYIFDQLPVYEEETFVERWTTLNTSPLMDRAKVLDQVFIHDPEELLAYEQVVLAQGYEGIMIRDPQGKYKYGRATAKGGELLKLKRFEDSEAVVLGVECLMKNGNEATTNELGATERSSHKAGMIPQDTLGNLLVKDIVSGVEFSIGSGFTADQRKQLWDDQDNLIGKLVTYKSFKIGVKDKPRFPIFKGVRNPLDMGE